MMRGFCIIEAQNNVSRACKLAGSHLPRIHLLGNGARLLLVNTADPKIFGEA